MEKNDFILLKEVNKYFCCSKTEVIKMVGLNKLKPERLEGESDMYVKREEVRKLFKVRKSDKESDNG